MSRQINIGSEEFTRLFFSYPNNFNEVGFLKQTLDETISIYLTSTRDRDGLSDLHFSLSRDAGNVILTVEGSDEDRFHDVFSGYVAAGRLALDGSIAINGAGMWRYNWRFFLPHGVAMVNHKTVELLHFPPDYVLQRDQDYLLAHTTRRWAALLVENGADTAETSRHQTIIDIAPVAAPSNAGGDLEGIYGHYSPYIKALFDLWLPRPAGDVRPMVCFGSPVRIWLKQAYAVDLKVITAAIINVSSKIAVPCLGSNHPSFIYNAVKRLSDDPNTPEDERIAAAMRIMQQDLVAARWQVLMGETPSADPFDTLRSCMGYWNDAARRQRICELTYEQAFNKTPSEAKALCAVLPPLQEAVLSSVHSSARLRIDELVGSLAEQIGPLDSREPDQIELEN